MSNPEPYIVTHEMYGHPTDFVFETKIEGDQCKITVTCVPPVVVRDGNQLVSFKPPRYPWPKAQ